MLHPAVYNVSQICHQLGVNDAVMSPGSRNAPLTISFARHDAIKKWIIPDERTAGFIALGLAQETGEPVVLCCTSGTALLNYAPAIAEAFYREIPLIILSADRPPDLIDQRDGQTIRQFEALKNHVKASYQLPLVDDQSAKQFTQKLIEGIRHSGERPRGPIHLNFPFKEPFYPTDSQQLSFQKIEIPKLHPEPLKTRLPELRAEHKKVLILIGQNDFDQELHRALVRIQGHIPVIVSPLNNVQIDGISKADLFISDQEELVPDLLITSGLSVLSKKLKTYIRRNKPKEHWHFDPAGVAVDTFETAPNLIRGSLSEFLTSIDPHDQDSAYIDTWRGFDSLASEQLSDVLVDGKFSELSAMHHILGAISGEDTTLHLGNSMPVRYAEILGVHKELKVYCNRGTSGIEGVTSTAMGTALASNRMNVLITGDLSFQYDRNAFFHGHSYPNLKIIVMNNQGGGIFRLINGPSAQPELEEYFETRHSRDARKVCEEYEIDYHSARDIDQVEAGIKEVLESEGAALLEIFTDPESNQEVYRELRNRFK